MLGSDHRRPTGISWRCSPIRFFRHPSAANADLVQAEPAQPLGPAHSPRADPVTGSHAAVSLRNLQPDGACDASRWDGGALTAASLLGRHRLDDQICAVRGIHRRCGKSERNLDQSADVSIRAPTLDLSRSSGESGLVPLLANSTGSRRCGPASSGAAMRPAAVWRLTVAPLD